VFLYTLCSLSCLRHSVSSLSVEALVETKVIQLQGFRKRKGCLGRGGGLGTVTKAGNMLGASYWEVRQWQQGRRR